MSTGSDSGASLRVGVLSDTHGQLDPRVEEALAGVDHILHAGDIGAMDVIGNLAAIAPVTAVRGNVDTSAWAWELPDEKVVELAGRRILVAHAVELVMRRHDPLAEGLSVVVTGHSHAPGIIRRDGVLYLNPGSAGRRRFHLPRAVALLDLPSLEAEIVILEAGSPAGR